MGMTLRGGIVRFPIRMGHRERARGEFGTGKGCVPSDPQLCSAVGRRTCRDRPAKKTQRRKSDVGTCATVVMWLAICVLVEDWHHTQLRYERRSWNSVEAVEAATSRR